MLQQLLIFCLASQFVCNSVALSPQLSPDCIGAIDTFSSSSTCHNTLTTVVQNEILFATCLQGGGSNPIDCSDIYSVMNAANGPNQYLVRPYYLPQQSQCSMCNHSIAESCQSLLVSISALAAGVGNIDDLVAAGGQEIAQKCSNLLDFAQLSGLRYQSMLLCESSKNYSYSITTVNTLNDALDMRSLLQCGTCSMIPCFYGQYCGQNQKAMMCPAGSYCPEPSIKLSCPSGHYCPLGSVSPFVCRGIASGSCTEGATREVVWVPLFIAVLLLVCIIYLSAYPPVWLSNILGTLQAVKSDNLSINFQLLASLDPDKQQFARGAGVKIEFSDLLLISGTNTRLNHLSGSVNPGRFTAIIGGSGAGKTTLMNVLLSREYQNEGSVKFFREGSQHPLKPKVLERIISFVPQTDVLLAEMTVFQLLQHSALMRLPKSKQGRVEAKINGVLDKLEIGHLRNVVAKRSIADSDVLSPGDKKKVSIAIELVAEPSVCFLDEPTTGIDASSAMAVALIIRDLAASGVTCVAVIHQPRGEIFSLIDDLIIMVPGGKLAFHGPAQLALKWFAMHGCILYHPKANKTDFILDVTSGNYDASRHSATIATSDAGTPVDTINSDSQTDDVQMRFNPLLGITKPTEWADKWREGGDEFLDNENLGSPAYQDKSMEDLDTSRPMFVNLLLLFLVRGLLQKIKAFSLVVSSANALVGGAIIGIVTSGAALMLPALPPTYLSSCPPGAEFQCHSWIRFEVGPATFLITMLLGAISVSTAVSTFGREKEYFGRETAVGSNQTAYFLGKIVADMILMALSAFIFTAALVGIGPWAAPFDLMWLVAFSIAVCFCSISYFISLGMSDPDNATLFGVILAILLNLFGGFVPLLGDGFVGKIFMTHYCARAITTVELQQGIGLTVEQFNSVVPDAWLDPNWHLDVLALWLFTLGFNMVSYCLLRWNNPRRYR